MGGPKENCAACGDGFIGMRRCSSSYIETGPRSRSRHGGPACARKALRHMLVERTHSKPALFVGSCRRCRAGATTSSRRARIGHQGLDITF
jgi:hypothetical protein